MLASIFRTLEKGTPSPPALSQWFLVLLRKGDSPVPSVMGPDKANFNFGGVV